MRNDLINQRNDLPVGRRGIRSAIHGFYGLHLTLIRNGQEEGVALPTGFMLCGVQRIRKPSQGIDARQQIVHLGGGRLLLKFVRAFLGGDLPVRIDGIQLVDTI